jgi:hypothetical protein
MATRMQGTALLPDLTMWADLNFALRSLRKNLWLPAVAILILK